MEVSEETTPDLLKNTPSNIARLEDVIENSKARHKYVAHTRSPSDGADVRWYFYKLPLRPNEVAASIPRSEIVGKGDYFRFGMRDSLAIEASFLQREEELLSNWWKEYAECSEGPMARPTSSNSLDFQMNATSTEVDLLYGSEEERVGVPVKGGLYEVDLVKRHCFPVYWNGENRRVLRGHWFARKGGGDWLPLREDVAEQLEIAYRSQVWHRRTFQPSGLFAARINLQGSTPGLHALFTGEDDTWEAWLNVDSSGFSSVIGFSGNGIKLRRGYSVSNSVKPTQDELRQQKEEEMDDYCSQVPVRHVVFMVHGIGQRLEKSNLVDDVANFRHVTASLSERHLTSHQRNTQRVLFIPCQWRKGLKLSGETTVEKITLDGVRDLRVLLGATAHDVLYYMSPIYCQNIIDSVSNQLNRLYLKFLKRNPGYDGKVSIYGHSLGSVLSYDILCHQENLLSQIPMDLLYNEQQARNTDSSPLLENSNQYSNDLVMDPNGNPSSIVDDTKREVDFKRESNEHNVISEEVGLVSPSSDLIEGMGTNTLKSEAISEHSTQMDEDALAEKDATVPRSSLDFSDLPTESVDTKQTGLEEVDHNLICDVTKIDYKEKDSIGEAISSKFDDCIGGLDKMVMKENNHDNDKDMEIKMLKQEIYLLKAKLAELGSRCGVKDADGGTLEESTEVCPQPEEPTSETTPCYTPYIRYTKLEFKVDTFFAVGSPLGVFLALRNIRIGIGKGQDYWEEENITEEMPACRQMFNIFHPFDPVAYRVEPLVCKDCVTMRPVIVPYHKGGKRLHIGFHDFTEDVSARSQAIKGYLSSVKVKVLTVCQSKNADTIEDEDENVLEKEERTYGSIMMERLTGSKEGRIDHMLQDKTFEHPYLQAIGAHTNYWRDYDTALFILKHLYREIPENIDLHNSAVGHCTEGETRPGVWSGHPENAEEELPLTFSDKERVRNISRTARKYYRNR